MHDTMISWLGITKFGDAVVMLPAAMGITAWLAATGMRQMALWWFALFSIASTLVAITKIAFIGWGIGSAALDFTGISGHSTFAAAVIPTLFFIALPSASSRGRMLGVGTGIIFALLVGVSRLEVHAHSASEVIAGCTLGFAVSIGFMRITRAHALPALPPLAAACIGGVLLAASFAQAAPTHDWISDIALLLSGHEQPFRRH
ncbi:MAG: membrane-associated phospholipid phosphatase [Janthinobacterium sp.]|jgi:membrane-associated phospholipid phosphatase